MVVLNLFGPLCPRQNAFDSFRKSVHAFFQYNSVKLIRELVGKNVGSGFLTKIVRVDHYLEKLFKVPATTMNVNGNQIKKNKSNQFPKILYPKFYTNRLTLSPYGQIM